MSIALFRSTNSPNRRLFANRDARIKRTKNSLLAKNQQGFRNSISALENIARSVKPHLESLLAADSLHHIVFWKHVAYNALEAFRAAAGFQTVCGSLLRRVQTVYDLAEKRRVSPGLVHDLTEIDNGGWRLEWTLAVRPEWACRTDLAKRIINAFFMRASGDLLHHRDASNPFPADNLNPGVLQLDIITEIRVGRLPEPFMQLSFGSFPRNDAKDSL